jgi:hypothetical protein
MICSLFLGPYITAPYDFTELILSTSHIFCGKNSILAAMSPHDGKTLESLDAMVVIRFAEPDEDNPFDWHPAKKW